MLIARVWRLLAVSTHRICQLGRRDLIDLVTYFQDCLTLFESLGLDHVTTRA
jgi:hypothetical protein